MDGHDRRMDRTTHGDPGAALDRARARSPPTSRARRPCSRPSSRPELDVSDIDCILLATLSPEHDFPGTSFFLHEAPRTLGDIPCIDLRAQCSGIPVLALSDGRLPDRQAGNYRPRGWSSAPRCIPRVWTSATAGRDVTVIFGDGAGAVVLEATDSRRRATRHDRDPRHPARCAGQTCAMRLWRRGTRVLGREMPRITHEMIDDRRVYWPYMDGRFVFKHAVHANAGGAPGNAQRSPASSSTTSTSSSSIRPTCASTSTWPVRSRSPRTAPSTTSSATGTARPARSRCCSPRRRAPASSSAASSSR